MDNGFVFERLLLAIASSNHKETEAYRLALLRTYADQSDPNTKRAAVRALGRMRTQGAKDALREIGRYSGRGEIMSMAMAYSE
jgi:hypothetical protein